MNPTIEILETDTAATPISKLDTCVRQHPGTTLLAAAGLGLAVVLIARALAPSAPRNRAAALLEDIQHSLAELAHLGYDRASELGADGAQAVTKGVESFNALHLDQKLDRFGRGLKKLFR